MDYLKDLGVGAVLLNSIYQSPQVDLGYDVSDFEKIDPIFGTSDDFESLVEALHGQGLCQFIISSDLIACYNVVYKLLTVIAGCL